MTLSFKKITKWLRELDINGCIGVGFGGGEPTLYPQLVELCKFASKKTNLAVSITTHAHNLNNDLLSQLDGNLHFIRVSMDGVGATYESIRNRSFDMLLDRITALRNISRFGINYLINSKTIGDLNEAFQLAKDLGASEFLLLPEIPIGKSIGIDKDTKNALHQWVNKYHDKIPLTISEDGSDGLPICNQFIADKDIYAYVHIDASGMMKQKSYCSDGIPIKTNGVVVAFDKLKTITRRLVNESMA